MRRTGQGMVLSPNPQRPVQRTPPIPGLERAGVPRGRQFVLRLPVQFFELGEPPLLLDHMLEQMTGQLFNGQLVALPAQQQVGQGIGGKFFRHTLGSPFENGENGWIDGDSRQTRTLTPSRAHALSLDCQGVETGGKVPFL
ncbi:MAG: hypothetical protein U0350_32085 [Caldilineaceae bacterium]